MTEIAPLGFSIDLSGLKSLNAAAADAAKTLTHLGEAEEKLDQKTKQTGKEQQALADSIKKTKEALDPALRATNEFTAAQEKLDKALHAGIVSQKEHANLLNALKGKYGVDEVGALSRQFGALTQSVSASQGTLQAMAGVMGGGGGGAGGLVGAVSGASGAFGGMIAALGPVGVGLAAGAIAVGSLAAAYKGLVLPLAQAEDKYRSLEGRLSNSLGSMDSAKSALSALYEQTQKTGLGFDSAADAFSRLARNNASIGLTQAEMLKLTDTVQKLGRVSGASTGEINAGMVQFGQALASGRLQGDELRSIMENFPALAKAVADNFQKADGTIGVTVGQLRQMGSEGLLTGSKVAEAALRASEVANQEYAKIPETLAQANAKVADQWSMLLAELGKQFNASSFAQNISNFTGNMIGGIRTTLSGDRETELNWQLFGGNTSAEVMGGLQGVTANRLKQEAAEKKKGEDAKSEALFNNALTTAEQFNGYASERLRATQSRDQLNTAVAATRARINEGVARPEEISGLPMLERAAAAAGMALNKLEQSVNTLGVALADTRQAVAGGGGGGGTSIYMQAIAAARASQERGAGGSIGANVSTLVATKLAGDESIGQANRDAAYAIKQANSAGQGRAAQMALEVDQAVSSKRFSLAGTISDPALNKFERDFRAAEIRRAAAQQNLGETNRVIGAQDTLAMSTAALAADPNARAQGRAGLAARLAQERKSFVADKNFEDYSAAQTKDYENKEANSQRMATEQLTRQLGLLKESGKLIALSSDEYAIQTTLLQTRSKLEAEGYKAGEAYYDTQLRITEEIERASLALDKQKARVRAVITTLEQGARSIEGPFKDAFQTVFTDGLSKGVNVFGKGMGDLIKKISADMIYLIAVKPFEEMAAQMASKLGQYILSFIRPGSVPSAAPKSSAPLPAGQMRAAHGAWFDGGTSNFAAGGAFTNKVYDQPTFFAFAGGGALGQMGEAGPEAIMPLQRGPDGRLGVGARGGGGDVQVVINDMRSSPNAERVEAKESRGPNGKRMISILVRDEVKRHIRTGDLDRDMSNSYGATRTLARK
ncbi:Caudovirus, tape measure, N-terminal [uncultured Caudovirales phage]|uniref:Caudovirus, tape measure, N-terminal n=1 Tax=uncultured Caudovirales phage TaxID=2100421 RepID=A0A6J5KK99_9CAUD|nr:Caudovirus, tape measure, N-terminal [uncultured Caudovirales phage]